MNQNTTLKAYLKFTKRLKLLISKNPENIIRTLENIFSMREIGNKTHGDLAEIGISEFINQFMYDYKSVHVGKDLYRAKEHEEDILVTNELNSKEEIPISLKAYGNGPLQLSTDKEAVLFPLLQKLTQGKNQITNKTQISSILSSEQFSQAFTLNVMPLIYDENKKQCNIMIFDFEKAWKSIDEIVFIDEDMHYDEETGKTIRKKGRKHPTFLFLSKHKYVFEVRYGNASANALQRGLWTHTKNAEEYFDSLTGWISYKTNNTLIKMFSLALVASKQAHTKACKLFQDDIDSFKDGTHA